MDILEKGIDVSKYQANINWTNVKDAGIKFAMLRAGFGKYTSQEDPCFANHYAGAKAAGIKVGAYWYSYAKTVEDAKAEAKAFLEVIKGKQFEYPVALDVEEASQSAKGKQFVSDVIRAFCEIVEAAGYFVCVYANKYWYDTFIDDDCKKKYDTWIAQWASACTYSGSYGIWQNTSDGAVNGIDGRVDVDMAYKDYANIMVKNGLNGYAKAEATAEAPVEATPIVEAVATPEPVGHNQGDKVHLEDAALYSTATTKTVAKKITGDFFIYDGKEISGRYRITNSADKCGKTPIGKNVTGFVSL